MFYAAKAGSLANIAELTAYGADVNHQGNPAIRRRKNLTGKFRPLIGKTPLFRARTYETAMFLMQKGADFTIRAKLYIEDVKDLNESMEGNNIPKEKTDDIPMLERSDNIEDMGILQKM